MKIKGNFTSVSIKRIPFYFLISSLAAIVLRSFQMLKFIDPETGFYKGGSIITVVLYALIAVSCLGFAVVSYLSAESPKLEVQGIKSKNAGIATLAFAVALLFDSVSSLISSGNLMTSSGGGAFKSMMLSGSAPTFFQGIFALISAVYFIILAKDFFKGTINASKHKILALAPVGWTGFRMIFRFVRQISFVKVSDLFLELIMLAFMIMFFMAFAQVAGGVYSDGFRWRIPALGIGGALIAATLSVSRLIFTVVNFEGYINTQHTFQLADLIFAVFAVVLLCETSKNLTPYTAYDEANDEE